MVSYLLFKLNCQDRETDFDGPILMTVRDRKKRHRAIFSQTVGCFLNHDAVLGLYAGYAVKELAAILLDVVCSNDHFEEYLSTWSDDSMWSRNSHRNDRDARPILVSFFAVLSLPFVIEASFSEGDIPISRSDSFLP
jgi:hypothetical protein